MKHVHWIGTGLSSIPGIRRLAKNLDNFTVWNRTLDKAIKSIDHVDKNNVNAKQFDIDLLFNETNPGDIVISQLPANKHLEIAKLCLKHKCHFASTSYLNPEINDLNPDVKKENLVSNKALRDQIVNFCTLALCAAEFDESLFTIRKSK